MRQVSEEELLEWAKMRADDAGRLARDLVALRNEMIGVLEDCETYFDNKADADGDEPNREMVLLSAVKGAISVAEGSERSTINGNETSALLAAAKNMIDLGIMNPTGNRKVAEGIDLLRKAVSAAERMASSLYCPFCGSSDLHAYGLANGREDILCEECGASAPVSIWDQRA